MDKNIKLATIDMYFSLHSSVTSFHSLPVHSLSVPLESQTKQERRDTAVHPWSHRQTSLFRPNTIHQALATFSHSAGELESYQHSIQQGGRPVMLRVCFDGVVITSLKQNRRPRCDKRCLVCLCNVHVCVTPQFATIDEQIQVSSSSFMQLVHLNTL